MQRILATCWDRGPANNVGPVVKALRDMDIHVDLFAGGPAKTALEHSAIEYQPYLAAEDTVSSCGRPAILYAGMDSNIRLPGFEVAKELEAQGVDCPFAFQGDFWGEGLYWRDKWAQLVPTRFFGNDQRDVELSRITFPLMDPVNALPLGWPWIDAYSDYSQIDTRARSLRQKLAIPEKMPVVFFAGQLDRTGEVIASLVRAIIAINRPVCLLSRMHPVMLLEYDQEGKWSAEYARYNAAVDEFTRWGKGNYVLCNDPYDVKDCIALATVVTGAFSTILIEAGIWRRQVIAILYPEVGMAEWLRTDGEAMPEFPLVELGCAAKATSDSELRGLLGEAYVGNLHERLRPNQERHLMASGDNAQKIAENIISLIR